MKKILALALGALLFSACQDAPSSTSSAPINFNGRAPLRLNVTQINVVETYRSPMTLPNVEHMAVTPPAMAIKQWVGQRLVAAGSQGTLEITIDDASIKQTELPLKSGVEGFFTDQQSERYDARVHVTMQLYDGVNTISAAQGDVDVSRMQTVGEKTTVAQREQALSAMVQDIMTRFDSAAETRLRQYFARFILG